MMIARMIRPITAVALVFSAAIASQTAFADPNSQFDPSQSSASNLTATSSRIINTDPLYIYIRTPGYLLNKDRYRESIILAQGWIKQFLKDNHAQIEEIINGPKGSKQGGSAVDSLMKAIQFSQETESFLTQVENEALRKGELASRIKSSGISLRPSAYMFFIGGKAPFGNLGISVHLGVAVMPYQLIQINRRTGETKSRLYMEYNVYVHSFADIGAPAERQTATDKRVGVGFIWGPLEKVQNLYGGIASMSFNGSVASIAKRFKILPPLQNNQNLMLNIRAGAITRKNNGSTGSSPSFNFNNGMPESGPTGDSSLAVNPFVMFSLSKSNNLSSGSYLNVGYSWPIQEYLMRLIENYAPNDMDGNNNNNNNQWGNPVPNGADPNGQFNPTNQSARPIATAGAKLTRLLGKTKIALGNARRFNSKKDLPRDMNIVWLKKLGIN